MSIKDMFAIAKSFQDYSNGLNNIKDYLQVENAINKNWQDALTFNHNVEAINAANAMNAYNDQQKLRKHQGEVSALEELTKYLYDAQTGTYRPEYMANQMAASSIQNTGNPYAMKANSDQYRATALALANAIAADDPAQAKNLLNRAWGNIGISASQNLDGTLNTRNSQGYTRTITDPNLASMYGADPLKTSSTLAGWKRDDQVSTRDYMEQMGLNADQAQHNRTNNELSLRLQHQLNQEANRDNAALKWDYALKEAEYKQKIAAAQAKLQGNKPQSIDQKLYTDVFNHNMKLAMESGLFSDMQSAHNTVKELTDDVFGIGTPKGEPNMLNLVQTNPTAPAASPNPSTQTNTPRELGGSTFAGTRFGSYEIPRPAATRQQEIDNLTQYLAQMQDKYQQNAQINPNSHIAQQQAKAIRDAQRQLELAQNMNDAAYFERNNPIEAMWNRAIYGVTMPSKIVR